MKRPPLVFRLMLSTIFLPIVLVFGVIWYIILFHELQVWESRGITLGMPTQWVVFSFLGLPFVLWLWMLRSGNWRRPLLFAGIAYSSLFVLSAFEIIREYTPPEKRLIDISYQDGIDVYCNDVHLGTTPLKIRVEDLVAKVPPWETPPEQRWYDDSEPPSFLYTYFPWDDFLRERFNASKELFGVAAGRQDGTNTFLPGSTKSRREAVRKHDAGCRYWWSLRQGKNQWVAYRVENPYYLNSSFDRTSGYFFFSAGSWFSPSARFHARLLVDVLPELEANSKQHKKAEWDRHVVEHWSHVGRLLKATLSDEVERLKNRNENIDRAGLFEHALDSTARLKYGLSDPVTEEECRRLLAEWVAESVKDRLFDFSFRTESDVDGGHSMVGMPFGLLTPSADVLREPLRKALAEQWRQDVFRLENGWAPVAYYSGQNRSPDYFADFACYSATTHNARIELLNNNDPRAAALFRTLLRRRGTPHLGTKMKYLYAQKILEYMAVENSLTETEFRDYVVAALSDPDHDDGTRATVERAVFNAIQYRIKNDKTNKDDLAGWVSTLPIKPGPKNLLLRTLQFKRNDAKSFADHLQQVAGMRALIETELTLDDVTKWFADHPDAGLGHFLAGHEETLYVSEAFESTNGIAFMVNDVRMDDGSVVMENYSAWVDLPVCVVRALLRCDGDTPEGAPATRAAIKQICTTSQSIVEQAIQAEYGGVDLNWRRHADFSGASSIHLPEYLFDLIEKMPHFSDLDGFPMAATLALCDSPRAGDTLEKWHENADRVTKPRTERFLETWRTRNLLHKKRMEFFHDLAVGRLGPDDLLTKQPSWTWKDGRYVQNLTIDD